MCKAIGAQAPPGRAWPLGRVGGSFGLVVRCRHVSPLALSGPSQGCLFPFSLPFLSSSPRFAPFRPLFSPSAVLGGGLCLGWHRFSLACDRARGAWSGRGPGPGRAWAWSGLAGLSGTSAPQSDHAAGTLLRAVAPEGRRMISGAVAPEGPLSLVPGVCAFGPHQVLG